MNVITSDPKMLSLLEVARNIATSKATVLITGESGTGKEILAQYIHSHSSRSKNRLIAINCAAVPGGLLESELFGHEKGAFTGAISSKPGKFELAHNSTLLLDELGEMELSLQSKLLRAIQESEIERVGGQKPIKIDVRIIATTNKNLARLVDDGKFREDLFYRLNVIPIEIPPLRLRKGDIKTLSEFFLSQSLIKNNLSSKSLSKEALNCLFNWNWPGNIRELQNAIERSTLIANTSIINAKDILIDKKDEKRPKPSFEPGMTISEAERLLILKTLEFTGQNRTHAAKMLGISIRTLRNKINEYKREQFYE